MQPKSSVHEVSQISLPSLLLKDSSLPWVLISSQWSHYVKDFGRGQWKEEGNFDLNFWRDQQWRWELISLGTFSELWGSEQSKGHFCKMTLECCEFSQFWSGVFAPSLKSLLGPGIRGSGWLILCKWYNYNLQTRNCWPSQLCLIAVWYRWFILK